MIFLVLYIVGILVTAYLIGRFGDTELTLTALVWPIWILIVIVSWVAMIGEYHRDKPL